MLPVSSPIDPGASSAVPLVKPPLVIRAGLAGTDVSASDDGGARDDLRIFEHLPCLIEVSRDAMRSQGSHRVILQ